MRSPRFPVRATRLAAASAAAAVTVLAGCSGAGQPVNPANSAASSLPPRQNYERSWMARGAAKQPSLLYVANARIERRHRLHLFRRRRLDSGWNPYRVFQARRNVHRQERRRLDTRCLHAKSLPIRARRNQAGRNHTRSRARRSLTIVPSIPIPAMWPWPTTVSSETFGFTRRVSAPERSTKSAATSNPITWRMTIRAISSSTAEIAYTNRVSLYEFPNGGDRFVHIALNGNPLNEPGALQWIKPTLLVGDQAIDGQTSLAHKVFISGSTATIVGQITFPETQHASAFWRRGDKIVVPDAAADAVEIYTFPGGALFATLTTQVSRPSGAVISQAGQDR